MNSDPAIIEAAAQALSADDDIQLWGIVDHEDYYPHIARCILTAVIPLIEAAALERAAQAFEPDEDGHDAHNYRWKVEEIAAAIRALKQN